MPFPPKAEDERCHSGKFCLPLATRGASQGAPTVQQVADRWHVLKNLREALERFLGRVHMRLQQRYAAVGGPTHAGGKQRRTKNEIVAAQMARARREARYEEVVTLYKQGTSIVRIAEDLHLSRTTVRKFVAAGAFPERSSTLRSKSILDPYLPFLKQRVTQGPINANRLWRELQDQGFLGGYKVVARWLQEQGWQLRKGRYSQARKREDYSQQLRTREVSVPQQPDGAESSAQVPPLPALESPRHLVWLFLLDPARLKEAEQQMLSFIRQEQGVEQAYTLAQQFVRLVREHEVEALEPWLSACLESPLPELESFAASLQKEIAAIRAAITLPYSTGPVEGHVNRLKLIKRSMYGRGSFPLLRHRVLYPASIALPLHESCG